MKIAVGQINTTIGDFTGNSRRMLDEAARAQRMGATMIVFPELSLCGYPPMDLLDHGAFVEANLRELRRFQHQLPDGIAAVVGHVDRSTASSGKSLQNVASVVFDGRIIHRQAKRLLPTYDVFDEARYFEPGTASATFTFEGIRFGIAICEDIWWETEPVPGTRYPIDPVRDVVDAGAQILLTPSASPFHGGKLRTRFALLSSIGRNSDVPVIYANLVGGNDSLVFDGYSIVTDARGRLIRLAPGFSEDLVLVDSAALFTRDDVTVLPEERALVSRDQAPERTFSDLEAALTLGLGDYLRKTGFDRVHLGLSGGIDSAVVAAVAARTLPPENVVAFLMPSQYSSAGSVTDAQLLAERLGVRHATLPIRPIYDAFMGVLEGEFGGTEPGIAEENIQARARGNLLMAWSNKFGSLLLTTGNKSELAVGYCTLYGDMSGGLGVIGDVLKTEVYGLARHFNRDAEVIPESILAKAPSAELRPDQTDQDSLPPYDVLDAILDRYLIASETYQEIVDAGHDPETVSRILTLVARAEYKRRQAPPVIKVSAKAFGTGRRMPIARRVYESSR